MAIDNYTGLTRDTFLKNTPKIIIQRAKEFIKIEKVRWGHFKTKRRVFTAVQTFTLDNGNEHVQEIRITNPNKYWVSCDCGNFKYVWEFALTKHGASSIKYSNGQPATKTNPKNIPGVCKHLYKLLNTKKIIAKLNTNYLKQIGENSDDR